MRRRLLPALLLSLMVVGAGPSSPDPTAHRRDIEAWRDRRLQSLRREDGWLTLVGLFWLEKGDNTVGSDPKSRVVLPAGKAPAHLATIALDAGVARLTAVPGETVEIGGKQISSTPLATDASDEATVVRRGSLRLYLIERNGRIGVRVKDSDSAALKSFHGVPSFSIDARWRIAARFEPYVPPKEISVPNVLGSISGEKSPGALVFQIGGKTCRLDVVTEAGTDDWFVIFGDQTNGRDTYGGGRFLYVTPPPAGTAPVVDFNKAYNPPCVFSPYATCPLPPSQNRLAVSIEAGEKSYGGH
ncbi:MAG: DUF1684 domain-containing protein [Acidobacteriota bacterium]